MQNFDSIDSYISTFPKDIQVTLEKIRQIIHKASPTAVEAIRYGMPTFRLNNKNLIHFAAYKNHIGLYPTPGPILKFAKELKGFKTSKGAIQFPLNKPVSYNLIERIVEYRINNL